MKTKLTVIAVGVAIVIAMSTVPTILSFEPARTIDNPDPNPNGFFGSNDMATGDINGDGFRDYVIVGLLNDDPTVGEAANNDGGLLYTFLGGASIPNPPTVGDRLQQDVGAEGGECFGCSNAIGDVTGSATADLITSAQANDFGGVGDGGRVFVFPGGADFNAGGGDLTPGTAGVVTLTTPASVTQDAQLGQAIAVGDFTGDGKADVAASAASDNGANNDEGKVYVWNGNPAGAIDVTADVTINSPIVGSSPILRTAAFGTALAAGDVNCDGRTDLVVGGALLTVDANAQQGRVYVFLGTSPGPGNLDATADATLNTPTAEAGIRFGLGLAVGDVNGDGCADILAGAPLQDVGGTPDAGAVYLFLGSGTVATLEAVDATITHPTGQSSAQFGRIVAVGDVNNDGFGDVFVGSPLWDVSGNADAGLVFRFNGATTFDTTLDETIQDPAVEAGAIFGRDVKVADINSDNLGDLIVGARQSAVGANADAGQAFVFLGSLTSLSPVPSVTQTPAVSPTPSIVTTPGFRG